MKKNETDGSYKIVDHQSDVEGSHMAGDEEDFLEFLPTSAKAKVSVSGISRKGPRLLVRGVRTEPAKLHQHAIDVDKPEKKEKNTRRRGIGVFTKPKVDRETREKRNKSRKRIKLMRTQHQKKKEAWEKAKEKAKKLDEVVNGDGEEVQKTIDPLVAAESGDGGYVVPKQVLTPKQKKERAVARARATRERNKKEKEEQMKKQGLTPRKTYDKATEGIYVNMPKLGNPKIMPLDSERLGFRGNYDDAAFMDRQRRRRELADAESNNDESSASSKNTTRDNPKSKGKRNANQKKRKATKPLRLTQIAEGDDPRSAERRLTYGEFSNELEYTSGQVDEIRGDVARRMKKMIGMEEEYLKLKKFVGKANALIASVKDPIKLARRKPLALNKEITSVLNGIVSFHNKMLYRMVDVLAQCDSMTQRIGEIDLTLLGRVLEVDLETRRRTQMERLRNNESLRKHLLLHPIRRPGDTMSTLNSRGYKPHFSVIELPHLVGKKEAIEKQKKKEKAEAEEKKSNTTNGADSHTTEEQETSTATTSPSVKGEDTSSSPSKDKKKSKSKFVPVPLPGEQITPAQIERSLREEHYKKVVSTIDFTSPSFDHEASLNRKEELRHRVSLQDAINAAVLENNQRPDYLLPEELEDDSPEGRSRIRPASGRIYIDMEKQREEDESFGLRPLATPSLRATMDQARGVQKRKKKKTRTIKRPKRKTEQHVLGTFSPKNLVDSMGLDTLRPDDIQSHIGISADSVTF